MQLVARGRDFSYYNYKLQIVVGIPENVAEAIIYGVGFFALKRAHSDAHILLVNHIPVRIGNYNFP